MTDRVLFVEDDETFRTIVARHLRRHGYEVVEAGSAEEARTALAGGTAPAVVLLDVNLPGDPGWSLLRSGPLADAVRDGLPVVVASAVTVDPARLREFHVAGYLPKPFPLETLLASIDRLIHQEGVTTEP